MKSAEVSELTRSFPQAELEETHIQQQTNWVAKHLGVAHVTTIEQVMTLSDAFLAQHASLLQQRSEAGLVWEVHGDLHTHNIFLYDDPVIFDCIEFNADFRRLDLLNEVVFLCMDLKAHGAAEYSRLFYKRYLHRAREQSVTVFSPINF